MPKISLAINESGYNDQLPVDELTMQTAVAAALTPSASDAVAVFFSSCWADKWDLLQLFHSELYQSF